MEHSQEYSKLEAQISEFDIYCRERQKTNILQSSDIDTLNSMQRQLQELDHAEREAAMQASPEEYWQDVHKNVVDVTVAAFVQQTKSTINNLLGHYVDHLHSVIGMQSRELAILHALEVRVFHGTLTPEALLKLQTALAEERAKVMQHKTVAETMLATRGVGNVASAIINRTAGNIPVQNQLPIHKPATAAALDIAGILSAPRK